MSKSPNLDFYRRRAKELLRRVRSGAPDAVQRFSKQITANLQQAALHDAQFVIARENGFSSWPRLKAYIDAMNRSPEQSPQERLQDILRSRDLDALGGFIEKDPGATHFRIADIGFTPLHIAASLGWEDGTTLLLDAGADINAASGGPAMTPLRTAIGYGQPALALLLLDRGADPHIAQPMQGAAFSGNKEIIRALAERGVQIDIFAAVTLEDEALVRDLAGRDRSIVGARMRPVQNTTITPLHLAVYHNSASMIDALLEAGSNPDDADEQGRTPIDFSLHTGKRKAYERLVARGCRPNPELLSLVQSAERSERIARLHTALVGGDVASVRVELDADPSLLNQRLPDVWGSGGTFGAAPLHWAAMFGHIPLARFLIERGADLDLRDLTYDGTPTGWAKEYGRREMCAFLEAYGAPRKASDDPNG